MILDYVVNPMTKVKYTLPRAQIQLTVPNERRNPVFVVPGGGGPINPKGNAAFDREPNVISYQFKVAPRADGQTFDQAREAFLKAIDHGRPQALNFLADDGRYWQMTGVLVHDPLAVDIKSPYEAIYNVAWVGTADLLAAPATPGAALFGTFKYGHAKKYGASLPTFNLTTNPAATIVLDNTALGATASTTDVVLNLTGAYGPTIPGNGNGIYITCVESGAQIFINDTLLPGETLTLDLAARRILKNGQPAFAKVFKTTAQRYLVELLHDTVNHLVIQFTGTPQATLNGMVSIKWKPKRGF